MSYQQRHNRIETRMNRSNNQTYTHIDAIVDLLGGTDVLGSDLKDRDQLLSVSRAGLPNESLQHLLSVLDDSSGQHTATTTWLRRKLRYNADPDAKLDAISSEMTLRVATLLVALIGVFEALEPSIDFLLAPHKALNGLAPARAVFTSDGVEAVNKLVAQGVLGLPA